MLKSYFEALFKTAQTGDATEESYYPDLKKLIENWSNEKDKKFSVTSLPKRTAAGNPDFRVWDGKQKIIGYIEAKDLGRDLDKLTPQEEKQVKRYKEELNGNLILTNFLEFRLFRNKQLINQVQIGRPFVIHKLKTVPPVENQEKFLELLEQFFAFSTPKTTTARALAIELAKRTRFLRDNVITEELKEEVIEGIQTLEGFYNAFKDHLISSLTPQDFANLFAQTITYGLFVARSRAENGFSRELAYKYIPHTIGILRDVFRFISSTDLPISMEWIVDDIAEVLAVADVKKIMGDFYKEGKGRDPIIHFYETFLAEYDPKEREKRGVYYTPEPVVGYIVRSIHKLLKEKFSKEDGFATQSVTVLDPAAGTLTFLAEAIHQAAEEYKKKYGDGGIKGLIKDHILKNFYAFELMMAPYAVGHLKIGFVLDEFGYKLSEDERFNLYLTNTLEFTKEDPNKLPGIFEQTIAKESGEALEIKEQIPIMVIVGNPPYSGISENKGEWILEQIEEYKQIEGKSLGERNPKWIQDDYVKFFRFAQWKIEKTGVGILGFITNHAWLDNPTFRGMRYSLLKTFDEIYILNLHGSTLKKEKTPKGGKDENVFDIQPGVAIAVFMKQKSRPITVTLDTCCIETQGEENLKKIEELESLGKIKIVVSSVTERESRSDPRGSKKARGKQKDLESAVWDESEWDNSIWGSEHSILEEVIQICFPEFPKQGKRESLSGGQERQLRDAMILEGHIRNKRDIFVTNDKKGFIKNGKRKSLKNKFNVEIYTPVEFLEKFRIKVGYSDRWGLREEKYDWLEKNEINSTDWQPITPSSPYYFFVPKEEKGWKVYQNFWKVTDIFPINSVGIVTARDRFVIDFEKRPLETRIRIFRDSKEDDEFIKSAYNLEDRPTFRWYVKEARKKLQNLKNWEKYFARILYRPFDERWIYYHSSVIERARENVMKHMLRPNLALITHKREELKLFYTHFLVTDKITEHGLLSGKTTNYQFPLYLYNDEEKVQQISFSLQNQPASGKKKPNINLELQALLNNTYNPQPVTTPIEEQKSFDVLPEEIFYYIYAVLYSNNYRQKYQEFLKIDFPRIPFTKDYNLFKKLAEFGKQLIDLHLLKSPELNNPIAKFPVKNSNQMKRREYEKKERRVYINDSQYFEGIEPEVWNYFIGGYQVLDKWLKDRRNRILSSEEIKHYCKVVTALKKTLEIQEKIGQLYPKIEQRLLDL